MSVFYKWLTLAKSTMYDTRLKDAIAVLTEKDKFNKFKPSKSDNEEPTEAFFKYVKDDKDVYDIYTECLHIHISLGQKEVIYSIRIKKQEDEWKINTSDPSHPDNATYEVYISYVVPVLDVTSAVGSMYKNGTWDESVYKAMRNFLNYVDKMKESHNFNESYK